jgi:DNA-directed RNA polymerase subunit RPC12/RpoP
MSEQTTATQHFPCPGCGSRVEYAPGTAAMKCPYCGYQQQIATPGRAIQEHSYDAWFAGPRKALAQVGRFVFLCQGCGARTESDQVSDRCQFCGSPVVAEQSAVELIAPEVVVPFHLGQPEVRDRFQKWVKSRWFAPSSLKKVGATEQLGGTYLPHWTFDSDTTTNYTGQRGEYYYTTETYTEQVDGQSVTRTRQVRHTRWYNADGTVRRVFDDVLVPATTALPPAQLKKLEPWVLSRGVAYQPEYLSGYRTLRYDIEPSTGLDAAKAEMKPIIEGDCRKDIGGDEQRVSTMDIHYAALMFKLVLLPVWIAAYLHAGKSWQVVINAATGEIIGQRPYSAGKIFLAVTAAIAVIVTLLVVYSMVHGHHT